MDNITHALVGAALGQAGLKRRAPLALTTLVIGANLPDLDGITYFTGGALGFRRGWTHGILAMAILPLLLTGVVLAADRWIRRRRRPEAPPAPPRQVVLLAFISVLTHPFLDFMNTYGVRFLMPFRDVWFYGDAWNIVDVWVWLLLGAGVVASSWLDRRGRLPVVADRPARLALALVTAYGLFMLVTSAVGRRAIGTQLAAAGHHPDAVMVSPTARNPLVRGIVVREGDVYHFGRLDLLGWKLRWQATPLPDRLADPRVRVAARTPLGGGFLHWARFPFAFVDTTAGQETVVLADARYGPQGWARVVIPAGGAAPPPRP